MVSFPSLCILKNVIVIDIYHHVRFTNHTANTGTIFLITNEFITSSGAPLLSRVHSTLAIAEYSTLVKMIPALQKPQLCRECIYNTRPNSILDYTMKKLPGCIRAFENIRTVFLYTSLLRGIITLKCCNETRRMIKNHEYQRPPALSLNFDNADRVCHWLFPTDGSVLFAT